MGMRALTAATTIGTTIAIQKVDKKLSIILNINSTINKVTITKHADEIIDR